MALLKASEAAEAGVRLSNAQTGTGPSTNVLDRGAARSACLLKLVSTVGATPTVTVAVEGSADNSSWWSVPYAVAATPETPVVAALTVTTAVTAYYVLRPDHPWRYLRLNLSANTNVTLTADVQGAGV